MAFGVRKGMAAGLLALVLVTAACSSKGGGSSTTPVGGQSSTSAASPSCAPASAAAGAVVSKVTQVNFAFHPPNCSVKSGSTITVTNSGTFNHTFTVDCTSISVENARSQSQTVKIALAPGTYRFYCQFHGTPTSGMHGTLTVT